MPNLSTLIGRGKELAQLSELLGAMQAPPGRLALVSGEAGVGKTRLLHALAERARSEGVRTLWGRTLDGDATPAYGCWVEALSGQGLRLEQLARAGTLGSLEDRARVFDAVTQHLITLAQDAPLLVVIEDLHWGDLESLLLLRHVLRASARARWLFVCSWRDPDAAAAAALARVLDDLLRDAALSLQLRPFSPEETATYLASAAGGRALPQALAAAIHAETAGNALYVREVFRHLVEEGTIVEHSSGWSTDRSLANLGIPLNVRHVVRRRFARLDDAAAALLLRAAACFTRIDLATIAAALGCTEQALLEPLDQAFRTGFLRHAEAGGYDFAHAIVRRALLEELNPERRQRLHRELAEALEGRAGEQASESSAEVAAQYHASRGLPGAERGVTYALDAAVCARAAGAPDRSLSFLQMARELARSAPLALRAEVACRCALGEAEALRHEGVAAALAEALTLLDQDASPAEQRAAFLARLANELKSGGARASLWEPLVERGLALCGARRDLVWARLMVLRDRIEPLLLGPVYIGRSLGFDAEAASALRAAGDPDDIASTADTHDYRSREECEALLRAARGWTRPAAAIRVIDVCARDLFFRHGDVRGALALSAEVRALAERSGSLRGAAAAVILAACCHALLGELAVARAAMHAARELAARLGTMHRLSIVGPTGAQVVLAYVAGGDWLATVAELARFASSPEAARTPFGQAASNLTLMGLALGGERDRALALIEPMLATLERAATTLAEHGAGRDIIALALWELELPEHASRVLRLSQADDVSRAGAAPFSCVALTRARMLALLGEPERAQSEFEAARALMLASGRRPIAAIVDYDEARMLLRAGRAPERAHVLLDRADATFRALAMTSWIERAAALAAQSAGATAPPDDLSPREIEILSLLARGCANKEIAAQLFISVATVERHVANIYQKTGARGRANATAYALRHGLVRGG